VGVLDASFLTDALTNSVAGNGGASPQLQGLGPDGLRDRKPPGQSSKLNHGQRRAIVRMIASGPIPARCTEVVRWRLIDLA
jgi:hypothetical protein